MYLPGRFPLDGHSPWAADEAGGTIAMANESNQRVGQLSRTSITRISYHERVHATAFLKY